MNRHQCQALLQDLREILECRNYPPLDQLLSETPDGQNQPQKLATLATLQTNEPCPASQQSDFEEWAGKEYPLELLRADDPSEGYRAKITQWAWEAWQASNCKPVNHQNENTNL